MSVLDEVRMLHWTLAGRIGCTAKHVHSYGARLSEVQVWHRILKHSSTDSERKVNHEKADTIANQRRALVLCYHRHMTKPVSVYCSLPITLFTFSRKVACLTFD